MSFIQFKTKTDLNIKLKTTVYNNQNIINNVYQISHTHDCINYFLTNTTYIGLIIDNIFYVINLFDSTFSEDFKNKFSFLNENHIHLLNSNLNSLTTIEKKERRKIKESLNEIYDFNYLSLPNECFNKINLDSTRNLLYTLNNELNCKYYRLSLDYVFEMENNTEINSAGYNSTTLLLCMFKQNICISSIIINYNEDNKEIIIYSKTKKEHEGNKINKLLRSIIVLISKELFPDVKSILSSSINPISSYLMINYLNAKAYDENDNELDISSFNSIKKYIDENNGIYTKIIVNEENINNAKTVFSNIIKNEFKCINGGKTIHKYNKNNNKKTKRKNK